jgi:hypothetical protein
MLLAFTGSSSPLTYGVASRFIVLHDQPNPSGNGDGILSRSAMGRYQQYDRDHDGKEITMREETG